MKTYYIVFDNFLQKNIITTYKVKLARSIIYNLEKDCNRVGRYKIKRLPVVKGVKYDF